MKRGIAAKNVERSETKTEHITPLPPAPRGRYLLRVRTDCGC